MLTASGAMTAARVALRVASWARVASTPRGDSPLTSPDLDVAMMILEDSSSEPGLVLTGEQASDIETFLQDPVVERLLEFAGIRTLAPDEDRIEIDETFGEEAFERLANQWCAESGKHWQGFIPQLWTNVVRAQELIFSRLAGKSSLTPEMRDAVLDRFYFGRIMDGRSVPQYLQEIDAISKNPARTGRIRQTLSEFARIEAGRDPDTFLVQGREEERAKFADLYIDRTLREANTGREVNASSQLDLIRANPRVLIVGDPGVGKTTLTDWVRWRLTESEPNESRPIIVRLVCRHALTGSQASLLGAVKNEIEASFQISLPTETIDDLLYLGWLALNVDGIDEILDPARRRSMVTQLHTFAERFPFAPIICTTRRTGFEVALFKSPIFRILNLEEYTDDQVVDYALRWFGRHADALKAERFVGESRTLSELRRNPLMLALLCTLYRQYDFIPRSRREVYLRCASLMFHEWDPRRGIAIPNLFKNEGEAILREIALLLYQVGGVSASLEEGQLVQLISGYLIEKGEDRLVADSAARDLLEYCSGRAWILSRVGDPRSVSRFAFTHRTFFEFFASEAIIRKLNRQSLLGQVQTQPGHLGPVTQSILRAYREDTSSVMPELLLQASDDLMGGISTVVIHELATESRRPNRIDTGQYIGLSIRLIAAAGVNPDVVDGVFDAMIGYWKTSNFESGPRSETLAEFRPVLDVSPANRARILSKLDADADGAETFLVRYSRVALVGETGLYAEEWEEAALRIAEGIDLESVDGVVVWFARQRAILSLEESLALTSGTQLLVLYGGDYFRPGLLWDALSPGVVETIDSATWRYVAKQLEEVVASEAVVDEGEIEFAVDHLEQLPEGTALPRNLVISIALLAPSASAGKVAHVFRAEQEAQFVAVLRKGRDDEHALSSTRKDVRERGRELIRAELNKAHKERYGRVCPGWLLSWAGVKPERGRREQSADLPWT